MRPPNRDTRASRHRPVDLKTSLLSRIALIAVACFVLVSTITVVDSERAARNQAATTADLVARHLSFQLLRINAGFDLSNRYPDWGAILATDPARGQCVSLQNAAGAMVRSDCVGSPAGIEPPAWFTAAWQLLAPAPTAASPVLYKDKSYGSVIVSSDSKVAAARAWDEIKPLLVLSAITILAVSLLVYAAIARALAPTRDVVSGLNRLSAGEFSHRLDRFKLAELQRIAEVANELAQTIEHTLAERADLARRLINAQEDERRYLARELHDELGQNLAAMSALAASIEKSAADADPETRAEAQTLSELAGHTMQSLRATLQHLRPVELDRFGLGESLKHLVDVWNVSRSRTTRFELELPSEMAPLSDTAANHVFRIAQEALTNAAKHADAATVRLRVEAISCAPRQPADGTSGIRLTVEDDGVGRTENGHAGNGMGLANIKERVAALGGTFALDERPGKGLTVSVTVPVETGAPQPEGCTS